MDTTWITSSIKSINDIKNAYYINLERRKDRKAHVESELEKIGIKTLLQKSVCNLKSFRAIQSVFDGIC